MISLRCALCTFCDANIYISAQIYDMHSTQSELIYERFDEIVKKIGKLKEEETTHRMLGVLYKTATLQPKVRR